MITNTPGSSSHPSLNLETTTPVASKKRAPLRHMSMTRSDLVRSNVMHQINSLSDQVVQGDREMVQYTKRLQIKELRWTETVQ